MLTSLWKPQVLYINRAFTWKNISSLSKLEDRATGGDEKFYDNQHKMRQIIGLLNHVAIHTRPDILFAVSNLATIMKNNLWFDGKLYLVIKELKDYKLINMCVKHSSDWSTNIEVRSMWK